MENVPKPSSHSSGVSGMEGSACFAMMKAMFSNSSKENKSRLEFSSSLFPMLFSSALRSL